MPETPEPLSAILAEFRAFALRAAEEDKMISPESVLLLADKVEAAAERERDEDRQLAAIAESDEAFARCARCDRPERTPGNAAALRKALERIRPLVRAAGVTPYVPERKALVDGALSIIDGALATPTRNCDRFATAEEARKAFEEEHSCEIVHNLYTAAFDWLFAEAEGGDHA